MKEPIRGKVARVINTRELAINRGTAHGVTVGMYFNVIDVNGEDVTDPDTGEMLGSIEREKVSVEIVHAQEKFSLARTYRSKEVNVGGSGGLFDFGPYARSLMPPKWITEYETLQKADKNLDPLDQEDSYINIGDPVIQVVKENELEKVDTSEE